jgi:DNA-binding response OmpR family regulator
MTRALMHNDTSLRILVVEDETLLAMMIEDMLVDLGHSVAAIAARVADAERHAASLEIDFAILDLNLDGENSLPVASILKRRGIPLIFSTGYGAESLGEEWAAIPVLAKPFQTHELRNIIARARVA